MTDEKKMQLAVPAVGQIVPSNERSEFLAKLAGDIDNTALEIRKRQGRNPPIQNIPSREEPDTIGTMTDNIIVPKISNEQYTKIKGEMEQGMAEIPNNTGKVARVEEYNERTILPSGEEWNGALALDTFEDNIKIDCGVPTQRPYIPIKEGWHVNYAFNKLSEYANKDRPVSMQEIRQFYPTRVDRNYYNRIDPRLTEAQARRDAYMAQESTYGEMINVIKNPPVIPDNSTAPLVNSMGEAEMQQAMQNIYDTALRMKESGVGNDKINLFVKEQLMALQLNPVALDKKQGYVDEQGRPLSNETMQMLNDRGGATRGAAVVSLKDQEDIRRAQIQSMGNRRQQREKIKTINREIGNLEERRELGEYNSMDEYINSFTRQNEYLEGLERSGRGPQQRVEPDIPRVLPQQPERYKGARTENMWNRARILPIDLQQKTSSEMRKDYLDEKQNILDPNNISMEVPMEVPMAVGNRQLVTLTEEKEISPMKTRSGTKIGK